MAKPTVLTAGVRDDLAAAHAATLADLARPGDFMVAQEKLALVRVVRTAEADADQPPWYRPSSEHNEHNELAPLPAAAVDAAWRITNHPGTLTADWHREIVAELPSPEYYIELVGVVAIANALDRFAAVLDLDVLSLPDPVAGEPSAPLIDSSVSSHWVPTATDYDGPNVLRAFSAAPGVAAMRTRLGAAQYMDAAGRADMNYSRGTLDRRQIELVAGVTSMHNECFY